ncbi:MAG TPA: malto-oligosyltrehalose trehalohydrolase [Candidatus Binatia bacterium]|nr:malto-oligosyltrehalose trehalohydrolase [Candidatus Binatia bacterium]
MRPARYTRRFPIGAELAPRGGAHFRVWAPKSSSVALQLSPTTKFQEGAVERIELEAEQQGYFSAYVAEARAGMFYRYAVGTGLFPDPVSRFQPEGPHGPSQLIGADEFPWQDQGWGGVPRAGQVIYEMHVGTFTRAGTWAAAQEQLSELAQMGITLVEVMPVAEFPGRFGWGYDGVALFAPTRLYGTPDDFRKFVDEAHRLGLGVILDVVYNHLGPDGNYLKHFSEDYFTGRHQNEWGQALNFDGPNSRPVREFFSTNAAYWISEFHLDGLRLDATQQMFDASPQHVLVEIAQAARSAAKSRTIYLVAENEAQHARLVRPAEAGGYGLDALWNDDLHHSATVALTGRNEAYYSDYRGTPQEFISAMKWGFLYQGQWFSWQNKRRGMPAFDLASEQFVIFLENHDQVANSQRGLRLHQLTSPRRLRALTALLLLSPPTPMLFQGQEFGATSPFLYFADHNPNLARLVAQGRAAFLRQFGPIACPEVEPYLSSPESEETFRRCKLDLSEREKHAELYRMHRELLAMRRDDPVFARPRARGLDGAVLGPEVFVLRFFGRKGDDRLLLVNLGLDLHLHPLPEPLLAPLEGCRWALKWSSEAPAYGGCGTAPLEKEGHWYVPGPSAVVMAPEGQNRYT